MKNKIILIIILLIFSCSSNLTEKSIIHTSDLPLGELVKQSGRKLINQSYGFTQIIADSSRFENELIIAVHGYDSRGYEWVYALKKFADNYSNVYFYRYDWNVCPDEVAQNLSESILIQFNDSVKFDNIQIFGHSYGGLVATYLASKLDIGVPVKIHTIASPLAGYPRIMDKCDFQYDTSNKIIYPKWQHNVTHYQWRTQKEQDGAFRDLAFDPQLIDFENSTITVLPDSMDGHRLGHNWSVTWTINYILNK